MLSATTFLLTVSIMNQAWALPPQGVAFGVPPPPPSGCSSEGVGFSARKAYGVNPQNLITAPERIRFEPSGDTLLSSFGLTPYHWDFSKFCAPCPGHYFFSFNAVSSENGDFTLALMKKEQHQAEAQYQVTAYGSKSGYQSAGNSAMIYLNYNDCLWLELQAGTIFEHPYSEAYTTFTGYLVARR